MINLKLLNQGLRGILKPSEFITLYAIESALGQKNEPKKIYNDMISDITGLSVSQVKRITKSLEEKGFILKKIIQKNKTKRETFYTLNLNRNESKYDKFEFTGEPYKQYKTIENNDKLFENEVKQSLNNTGLDYNIIEREIKKDDEQKRLLEEGLNAWAATVKHQQDYDELDFLK